MQNKVRDAKFIHALLPILFLTSIIFYGLILRPLQFGQASLPLEIIFILAATFIIVELMVLGHSWDSIQASIISKIAKAFPAFLILFSIGLIIGSWMICGTIPMLVYYGLKLINPKFIYLLAFLIPIVFSSLTGTSWGSVGSIGIVLMGIALAMDAHLGITAGAIIGGAFFGDKMSPLSDTTNMAAIAAEVDLFDHIRSMMYTTVPSTAAAAVIYLALGFIYPPQINTADYATVAPFLESLESMFAFNILLILPPLIVLVGSVSGKPTIPVLVIATLAASVLAMLFQSYTLGDLFQSLYKGFTTDMAHWAVQPPEKVVQLLNRGGLYTLSEAVIIAFTVFCFIGAMDMINAMPMVVNRVFNFARKRWNVIASSLVAAGITNALTSNQYATSFIVGDAFKNKYDKLGISRKVLSRSLEDTGTMIESLVPWHPTAVFMVATLGVPFADYWHWQFLSMINMSIAFLWAITGIGCFMNSDKKG